MLPQKKRILYVEDDLDTCDLLTILLFDYELIVARTVAEGLNLARNHYFDLYLLDNWLPDGVGATLCRQIRAFDPHTPVVFYSAVVTDVAQQEAITAGAQAYVRKPGSIEELEQTIARVIKEAGLQVFEARRAEIAAIRDELASRQTEIAARLAQADEKNARAQEQVIKIKACQAFLNAGGTRADFERLWPDFLRDQLCP